MNASRKKRLKHFRRCVAYAAPAILLLTVWICSRKPALAEGYMCHVYPAVATTLSFFSRLFPFSFFDVLLLAFVVLLAGGLVAVIAKKLRFRQWLGCCCRCVLWLPVWFYLSWGMAYFRPDFHERMAVERQTPDKAFFETFVIQHIDSLNCAYVAMDAFDTEEIDREIERMYGKHHALLRLPYPCGTRRTKHSLTEPLLTQMGITGFFNPFFNEVQVNRFMLPQSYPFTLAHEKAHQLGIAGEAECNFYASVICTASEHPQVRYSGYLKTTSYLLNSLYGISPDEYKRIYGMIDSCVVADYRKIREHWKKAIRPVLSEAQNKLYDHYLKTNRQASGIKSYSEVTGLLVDWATSQTAK
ncbi:MAG: DUF3810 domain-containing protein [Bacteroidales bacterium]|jgi:hypothetical protein|nr:DUF3810 domain-containing protein [Bacteroidales bacterium]